MASDDDIISRGHLYFAPADFHMMLKDGGAITVNQGARKHRYRPSIDILFRSAAVYYGSRVIAIILSGMLYDGTAGMIAVKRCGGTGIVQDPEEAEYNQMPASVLNNINVDFTMPLTEIGYVVEDLLSRPLPPAVLPPAELIFEVEMTERITTSIGNLPEIGERTDSICPDCGGGLWEIKNDPSHRFRCHVGHVYSDKELLRDHSREIEESVWASLRMLEERRMMLEDMDRHVTESNRHYLSTFYSERINETEKHIQSLKTLLSNLTRGLNIENPL